MLLEILYEKVTKVLHARGGVEIQVQGQSRSPVGRLVGTEIIAKEFCVLHLTVVVIFRMLQAGTVLGLGALLHVL
jgi:hypothetical protein